ncbi:hypothetical protein [Paenibacillus illinoisensis]|uniref:hypothetical protein n=1 Tax=Paenibacillus illinoisensis TaxID=59845 RepID=UPI003017C390
MIKQIPAFRTISLALILFLLGVLVYPSSYSSAAASFSDEDYQNIAEHMRKDGSSQDDINSVINKLKNGEILDADKPNSTALRTTDANNNESLTVTSENPTIHQKFEDGSYKKLRLVIEPTNVSTTASNGASLYFKVEGTSVFGTASFNTSAFIDTHIGSSYITGVSGPSIHSIMGVYSDEKLVIDRLTEIRSKSIPAEAHLSYKHTSYGGVSAKTRELRVKIGDHIDDRYGIAVTFTDGKGSYQ